MEKLKLNVQKVVVGSEMTTSPEIKSEPNIEVPSLQYDKHQSLQCFDCFITFPNDKSKLRHMKNNHTEEYKRHLQRTNTVYACFVCNRRFSSSAKLSQHNSSHSAEDKPFNCKSCRESFPTFSELMAHRREECTKRQVRCKHCGMVFQKPSSLHNHRRAVHLQTLKEEADVDPAPHRCLRCNHAAQTEEELAEHHEVCTDGRPPRKRGRPYKGGAVGEPTPEKNSEGDGETQRPETKTARPRGRQQAVPGLDIPCPKENCDLLFSSVEELRAHKMDQHKPAPSPELSASQLPQLWKELWLGKQTENSPHDP